MTLAHWRDIALLILVIEALLGTVLIAVATLLLASIVRRTNAALRDVLTSGQAHAARIAAQTDAVSRKNLVDPVVRVHAASAGAQAFLRSIARSARFNAS